MRSIIIYYYYYFYGHNMFKASMEMKLLISGMKLKFLHISYSPVLPSVCYG